MFRACLASRKPSAQVSDAAQRAIAEAVFSYVSMVTVTAIVNGCKMVTEKHVASVEEILCRSRKGSQKGGKGMDTTGIMASAYSSGNGAGTNAAQVDFGSGVARAEHAITGGALSAAACTSSIHAAVKKEVDLILKDQSMRKKSGVVALITEKIEGRITAFLHPLVTGTTVLRVSDVKKATKTAFRGLRIILA